MPRMTSCPSTEKSYSSLAPVGSHRRRSQLQSQGVGAPAPIVYFVLIVKLTAPVPGSHHQVKGPRQGVCRKESHWMYVILELRSFSSSLWLSGQGGDYWNESSISKVEAKFWGRAVAIVTMLTAWVRARSHFARTTSSLWGCACETECQVMLNDNKINVFIFNRWTKRTQNLIVFFWNAWTLLNTIQMKLKHIYLYYAFYLLC